MEEKTTCTKGLWQVVMCCDNRRSARPPWGKWGQGVYDKAEEIGGGQTLQGFPIHVKNFGFYPRSNEEPLIILGNKQEATGSLVAKI